MITSANNFGNYVLLLVVGFVVVAKLIIILPHRFFMACLLQA
jgi:hypothetical protein